MVLVLVAVGSQLRAVLIPLKVGPDLVAAILQIGIVAQVVLFLSPAVSNLADPLGLHLNGLHHPHRVYDPKDGGLPVHGVQYPLEGLIGGHLVRALFPTHAHNGVRKQGVVPRHLKLHNVVILGVFHSRTSQNSCFSVSVTRPTVSS